jgi:sulfofructose kinase
MNAAASRSPSGPRLLCVGHASVDHLFEVEALVLPPAKLPARSHWRMVGGMSTNAAVAAARLGARVAFAGPVGDDEGATLLEAHLAAEGIEARGVTRVPGTSTSISSVIVDARGERLIVVHRGDALARAPRFDPAWLDGIELLLTDPRCAAWAEAALRAAQERGIPSVLDADLAPREDLQRLVPLARWAVFSEPGLAAFSDAPAERGLAAAIAAGARSAVVTHGERGLLWRDGDSPTRQLPAFVLTPVVDTTAAGDVFHAALGIALAEGQADRAALRFASAAAALKCLRPRGALGAPARAEVEALLSRDRSAPAPD